MGEEREEVEGVKGAGTRLTSSETEMRTWMLALSLTLPLLLPLLLLLPLDGVGQNSTEASIDRPKVAPTSDCVIPGQTRPVKVTVSPYTRSAVRLPALISYLIRAPSDFGAESRLSNL